MDIKPSFIEKIIKFEKRILSQQRFKVKSKIQILVIGERGRSKLERANIKRGMGYQDQVTENDNRT